MVIRERMLAHFHTRAEHFMAMPIEELRRGLADPKASAGDLLIMSAIAKGISGNPRFTALLWERMLGAAVRSSVDADADPDKPQERPYSALPASSLVEAVKLLQELRSAQAQTKEVKDVSAHEDD